MAKISKEPSSTFINPAAKLKLHSVKNTAYLRVLLHTVILSISKHYNSEPADKTKENQMIASKILLIQAGYNKRLGAYKTTYVLQRDYGIHINVGRV